MKLFYGLTIACLVGCTRPPLPAWECHQIDTVRYVSIQSTQPRISLIVGQKGRYAVWGIPSAQHGVPLKACTQQDFYGHTKFRYWVDGQSLGRVQ